MPGGRGRGTQLWVSWTASGRAIVGEHWERHLPAREGVTSTLQIGPGSQCESPHSTVLNGGGGWGRATGDGLGYGTEPVGLEAPQVEGNRGAVGEPLCAQACRQFPAGCRAAGSSTETRAARQPGANAPWGGPFSAHSGTRGQGVCRANEPHLSVKLLANHVNSLCRGGGAKPLKCKAAALPSPRRRLPLSSAQGTWGHALAVCTFVCICTCVHGQERASLCV